MLLLSGCVTVLYQVLRPANIPSKAGGQVGKYVTDALLKTGKHKVTALTRPESTSAMPAGVSVKKVDYEDSTSLTAALRGQELLIITMAVTAPKEQQTKLIDAAAAAGVPWVMPNEFGNDNDLESLSKETLIGEGLMKVRQYIDQVGKSTWIGLACGFWYEYSLSSSPLLYGFDFKNRAVTFYDEGTARINTSTWPQTGRAVARLLSLKILKDDESDKSPTLTDYARRTVFVSSFCLSQRDMFDSALRVTGTTPADWTVTHEPSAERYAAGLQQLQTGDRMGFGKLLYARVFYPNDDGNFEKRKGTQNEMLGLPKEDLDEYTKIAVEMAEKNPGF